MQPISTRLVPHGSASMINQAAGFRTAFDKRAGRDFVRVEPAAPGSGSRSPGPSPSAAPSVARRSPTCDVVGTTDLEYESRANGLKETLVLAGPDAPVAYRFRLTQLDGGSSARSARPTAPGSSAAGAGAARASSSRRRGRSTPAEPGCAAPARSWRSSATARTS